MEDRRFALVLAASLGVAAAFVALAATAPARALRDREVRWHHRLAPGDLVFEDLDCGVRCDLIRDVTRSRYTHVGLVLEEDGVPMVWEAFHAVAPTATTEFVSRGHGERVAVYRVEPALLARLDAIGRAVRAMRGRPYDGLYQWDDARIYCSELVEKAVLAATGVALAPPHALGPGAFGAHAAEIARLSRGALTEATPMTTPVDLARSPHVRRVVDELGDRAVCDDELRAP